MPDYILPKKRPREMTFLGTVEWAWGPMSSRVETYWLHRAKRHWVVWIEDRDGTNDPEYKWQVAAYVERVSAEVAAPHLIAARWELEMEERQLDQFHFVSNEGALAVAEWAAIGRAVWR